MALQHTYEPTIHPNDILNIQVASLNVDATRFFNPADQGNEYQGSSLTSYMVDLNGDIEIPLVGKVQVAGLTTRQIRDTLRSRLEKYLESPTLRVSFESYAVTLLGEVKSPGLYQVRSEKITITDALGMAGDLTIFGDRKKVMIIRETEGKKNFYHTDLTRRDVFTSELYYLHPGDIVYVPAGKGRIASADAFFRITPIIISSLTLITLIYFRANN
jgi:polysaccharide biosynthesis/export protein